METADASDHENSHAVIKGDKTAKDLSGWQGIHGREIATRP